MKCSLGISNFLEEISAAAANSLQSCPTLCDPIDGSPPGSPVPGILQAKTLEWVALSFSSAWKWKVKGSHSVVSDSSRSHGLQHTRFLHPWDLPGKSTGVGCLCLLLEEISSLSHSVVFLYFFALIAEEGYLISSCYSLEFCIQMGLSFLFSFAFGFSSLHSYL